MVAMPTRVLIAYLLIAVLLGGGAFVIRRAVYNSEHNVRRRARRERRARYKAELETTDEDDGDS